MKTLSISIVVYRPIEKELYITLKSLYKAIINAKRNSKISKFYIDIVNNDSTRKTNLIVKNYIIRFIKEDFVQVDILDGHGNVGYGCGHNLSIKMQKSDYHLILNPDVMIHEQALTNGIEYLNNNSSVGLVVPRVKNEPLGHLCKKYPSVMCLFIRGFVRGTLIDKFKNKLNNYNCIEIQCDRINCDVELASGCFMLYRTKILRELNGFDSKYFLYFEDFDLSLRTKKFAQISYLPNMVICHYGGNAAKKGVRQTMLFILSAVKFFNTHGWVWL